METRRQSKEARQKRRAWWRFLFLVCFLLAASGAVYFLVFSGYFAIAQVGISGNREVKTADLENFLRDFQAEKTLFIELNKNLAFFRAEDFSRQIDEKFPEIKEIELEKKWPKGLEVRIKEKEAVGVYCPVKKSQEEEDLSVKKVLSAEETASASAETVVREKEDLGEFWEQMKAEECFFVNLEGTAFKPTSLILGGKFTPVFAFGERECLKAKVLDETSLIFVETLQKRLSEFGVEPARFFVEEAGRELRVLTGQNWTAVFDLTENLESQILVLQKTLDEEIKEKASGLLYVDLRVPGRAYYKLGN